MGAVSALGQSRPSRLLRISKGRCKVCTAYSAVKHMEDDAAPLDKPCLCYGLKSRLRNLLDLQKVCRTSARLDEEGRTQSAIKVIAKNGGPAGIRTPNQGIMSRTATL